MILLVLPYALYRPKTKKEGAETFQNSDEEGNAVSLIGGLVALGISIGCIYLSWTCNSKETISTGWKVFFAFWAWFFGILYLIYYALFRFSTCPL